MTPNEEMEQLFRWRTDIEKQLTKKVEELDKLHNSIQYLRFQANQISKEMTALRLAQRSIK